MADTAEKTGSGRGRAAADASENGSKAVEYIVLQQRLVQTLIDDGTEGPDGPAATSEKPRQAWIPVMAGSKPKVFTAAKPEQAIEQHTGKGEGTKPGTWKAVTVRTWKGVVTTRPPKQVLEDDRDTSDDL